METRKVDIPCRVNGGVYAALFSAAVMFSVSGIVFEISWLILTGILSGTAAVSVMAKNRGKCWATSDGVVIKMPFKKTRLIPYCDIKTAYITLASAGPLQEFANQIGLYQMLHIVTGSGDISFLIREGCMCLAADLYDDTLRAAVIERSPFAEIVNMVKANCGADPLEGYLYR